MTNQDPKNRYAHTLNLPQTTFSLRANAHEKEPSLLAYWKEIELYKKTSTREGQAQDFILLDGPPYANGHIHMGTTANKILKDIICKSKRMSGYYTPFKPGWDCHGLPIELKVTQEMGIEGTNSKVDSLELKKACRVYAQQWINVQREEFKKLGICADWDNPYATMDPIFEGGILRAFARCINDGYIERKNKTIPWCATCKTVLATVEIEYAERKDPSCYIFFPLELKGAQKFNDLMVAHNLEQLGLLVWTTTPWTIPLNKAVVLNPSAHYVLVKDKEKKRAFFIGKERLESLCNLFGIEQTILAEVPARELVKLQALHPFIDNQATPLIADQSVSLSEGTACMHLAPGCGPEDYMIALQHHLEIFSPLSPDGRYTVGINPTELEEMLVADGQIWVIKKLAEKGNLVYKTSIRHSYPHCWRCRNGLMFRATKQWFCSLTKNDLIKKTALEIEKLFFVPETGRARLASTIENRAEWCISRQRRWGSPITALICSLCDEAFIDAPFVEKCAARIEKEGIEWWDRITLEEMSKAGIIRSDFSCKGCSNKALTHFRKEHDILDVWFDSGVIQYALPGEDARIRIPADVVCEGSDQHRGWFQSSLLTSMILRSESHTKGFVTHGFVVDSNGHKMSKSLGNTILPSEIIEKYSTDILRLWVASTDSTKDMVVSHDLLKQVSENYRKIRNTMRFLLGNLYDFDSAKDSVAPRDMHPLDRYALAELERLMSEVKEAYAVYDCMAVTRLLVTYCATTLSAFYLDIIKDRLYVEDKTSTTRRSAQSACFYILDSLTRAMAPILSFLAEETFEYYKGDQQSRSIHTELFSRYANEVSTAEEFDWEALLLVRSLVLKALEGARAVGTIGHSLDARVAIHVDPINEQAQKIDRVLKGIQQNTQYARFLKDFFIVSQVEFARSRDGLSESALEGVFLFVDHAQGEKCLRCWQWEKEGCTNDLCLRCQKVLGS